MSTPITDAAEDEIANDDSIHIETELEAMANFARLLETDRAALFDALCEIHCVAEAGSRIEGMALEAIAAARANFPTDRIAG